MIQLFSTLEGNNSRWISKKSKHETLEELRGHWKTRRTLSDILQRRAVGKYFTFGFVRNPWDRISSLYRYLLEKRPRKELETVGSFSDFIEQADAGVSWVRGLHSMRPQVDFFHSLDDGRISADFVGHFEHLNEDFLSVTESLGIPPFQLPHNNRSSNSQVDYRKQYSDRMAGVVEDLFREDVDAFGYVFDQSRPARRCSGRLSLPTHTAAKAGNNVGGSLFSAPVEKRSVARLAE